MAIGVSGSAGASLGRFSRRRVPGETIKELIREAFGDGIMSAIDFSMDISRVADPKGDRVQIVLNGKFLPCKAR
ncbi:Cyanate hydratase [Pseudomonas sp. THAF187a]|nr:Cyanate hydratase [Pseudomonas sp. THAF187a]QFT40681.1 Cyanate hydratase [Pseudomonas sp. THAF42]